MTSTPESEGDLLEVAVGDSEVLQLAVGTVACVWNYFLRRWTGGFAVAEVLASGYRLRRLSDDHVFSHVFSADEVMEERRKILEPGIPGVHVDRRIADAALYAPTTSTTMTTDVTTTTAAPNTPTPSSSHATATGCQGTYMYSCGVVTATLNTQGPALVSFTSTACDPQVEVVGASANPVAGQNGAVGATKEQVDRLRRSILRKRISIMNLLTLGIAIGALSAIFGNMVFVMLFTIFLVLNGVRMYLLAPFIARGVRKGLAG